MIPESRTLLALRAYREGEATWEETLATLKAIPKGVRPPRPALPVDVMDLGRWMQEVDDYPYPIDNTSDDLDLARLRGWITPAESEQIYREVFGPDATPSS